MPTQRVITLASLSVLTGFTAAILLAGWLGIGVIKPVIEKRASEKSGMEVRVGGPILLGFYPGLHLTLHDVHVRNRGSGLITAREARIQFDLSALLSGQTRVQAVHIMTPRLRIGQDPSGRYNFETDVPTSDTSSAWRLDRVLLADATLELHTRQPGQTVLLQGCTLDVRDMAIAGGADADWLNRLSMHADLDCMEARTGAQAITDLALSLRVGRGCSTSTCADCVSMKARVWDHCALILPGPNRAIRRGLS